MFKKFQVTQIKIHSCITMYIIGCFMQIVKQFIYCNLYDTLQCVSALENSVTPVHQVR